MQEVQSAPILLRVVQSVAKISGMKYFAIHYTYADEADEIVALRPKHREFLGSLKDQGKLVASGPYTDGLGSALIIIRLDSPASIDDAIQLMNDDPFHTEKAIATRTIREWNPVLNIFGDNEACDA